MKKFWTLLVLLVVIALVCGCAAKKDGMPQRPDPTPTLITYYAVPPTMTESPAENETSYSIYMYSTARGYKYHDAGFVCTSDDRVQISGPEGLIGIWCER